MLQPALKDIFQNEFYGIDSAEVYTAVVNDAEVFELLADIVQLTYATFLGTDGYRFVVDYLQGIRALDPGCTTDEIKAVMLDARKKFQSSRLNNCYHRDFRKSNLTTSIESVGPDRFRGRVVDIGAYDNRLGHLLLQQCDDVSCVTGVDIVAANDVIIGKNLEFSLLKEPDQLPIDDSDADTVVLRYVLHHVPMEQQVSILKEVVRILRTGGTALMYENTYSFVQPPVEDRHSLHQRIIGLDSPERIRLLLATLDTFSQGIKEKHGPFPFSYRSVEGWLEATAHTGLDIDNLLYYGMPIFDLHQAPLGIFVLRNA